MLVRASHSTNNFKVWFDLVLHFFCFMYFYITLQPLVSDWGDASYC